ncbi:RNA polymerase sigma factor [Halioxenophilus sp. WMMB6]|uniref:RNA polymerase sigma factor n=1 Tax=Halioxenophilus sp. WMMB6 TaxID=3073815 RepID=UPI00295F4095|nr:RNA polymerase sigma factor [Halioxenophilus sp. WMMB6]
MDRFEQKLVKAAQKGDSKAFEQLYRLHHGRVYALSLRLCGDRHWAEDLCQDAFVRAWNKLSSFKGESQFGTWLYRVTANLVLSSLRRSKAKFEDDIETVAELGESDRPLDLDGDLEKAMHKLPDGARTVLVLYSLEGYTHEEIADMLNIAVGTSKAQLHRARSALKTWLA